MTSTVLEAVGAAMVLYFPAALSVGCHLTIFSVVPDEDSRVFCFSSLVVIENTARKMRGHADAHSELYSPIQ